MIRQFKIVFVGITIFLWTNFIRLHTLRPHPSTKSSKIKRKSNDKPFAKRIFSTVIFRPTNKHSHKMSNKNTNFISTIKLKLNLIFSSRKIKHSKKINILKELMILKWQEVSLSKKVSIEGPCFKILKNEKNKIKQKVDFMNLHNNRMIF